MSAPERTPIERAGKRLSIELRPEPGPIAGLLSGDGAAPIEFSGWIQLAELIEGQRPSLEGDPQPGKGHQS